MPLAIVLSRAALYFSSADLCFTGSFSSQASSSNGLALAKAASIFWWHLMTAATSLPSSLPSVSSHFRLSFVFGTQPTSSRRHLAEPPPQSASEAQQRVPLFGPPWQIVSSMNCAPPVESQ